MRKILSLILCFLMIGCGKAFNIENAVKNVDKLKDDSTLGYSSLEEESKEKMKNLYSIDASKTDYIMFKKTKDSSEVDQYLIVKIKNKEIEQEIESYFESVEIQCEMYDPKNASKVKNRLEEKVNGYNVYIISNDNEKVLEAIKNS